MATKVRAERLTHKRAMVVEPPPLNSGDRLTRREFERRYSALPQIKKAELVEGVVYVASPVRFFGHAQPHGQIIGWLAVYCAATPGVQFADNATVRLDPDNEPQPDALLRIDPAVGGRSRIAEDDYLEGAPELIVEIAASSAAYDLYDKLHAYRRNGVQEYMVWQIYDDRVDWWELHEDEYRPLDADEAGVVASRIFPGLRLAVPALLDGDLAAVLATLREGLETEEHSTFVARLGGKAA